MPFFPPGETATLAFCGKSHYRAGALISIGGGGEDCHSGQAKCSDPSSFSIFGENGRGLPSAIDQFRRERKDEQGGFS